MTANYEQLIAGHAYWSDKAKEDLSIHFDLKDSCAINVGFPPSGNCFEKAYKLVGQNRADADEAFEEGYGDWCTASFDEIFSGTSTHDFEACDHCKKVRDLKKKRTYAKRRLGAIRAAMTRVGRNIDYITD
jgi:hypothetical protein